MSFLTLQLLFVALALGLLAALGILVVRLRRRRQHQTPAAQTKPASKAASEPKPRKTFAARQAEPEPEFDVTMPVRRRQLNTFAEDERIAAQADALGLPMPEPDEPEPEAPEPEPLEPVTPEPVEPETSEADAMPDFEQLVLGRLEAAFDALQAGNITLAAYRDLVVEEGEAVERHIARHRETGDEIKLEAALAARESVRWCLDWADEQAR